jgi:hypothetical protein
MNIVHFVFDVKCDLRHKARLDACGHITDRSKDEPILESKCTMRIAITVGEMNCPNIMVGDISSSYLEAYTQGKVRFIAGSAFGPLLGHLLVIDQAI